MNANPWTRLDLPLLLQAVGDTLTTARLTSLVGCFAFALLALALALCTAHAFSSWQPQTQRIGRGIAAIAAVLPPAAPALALAGWAGSRGWPVPSLMPTERGESFADFLWFWLPPLLLLTALLTLARLATAPDLRRNCLQAVAGAWLLNDALVLFPELSTPARAILANNPVSFAQSLVELALLAAAARTLAAVARPHPVEPQPNAARRLLEGGIVLGHSPWASWRRHRLPALTRQYLAQLARLLAWVMVAVGNTALLTPLPGWPGLQRAGAAFLEHPAWVIPAVWPVLLCVLSLQLAARMLLKPVPRSAKP